MLASFTSASKLWIQPVTVRAQRRKATIWPRRAIYSRDEAMSVFIKWIVKK